MNEKVVDFEAARIRIALNKFDATGEVADYLLENGNIRNKAYTLGNRAALQRVKTSLEVHQLYSYIDLQTEFTKERKELESDWHTARSDFMFPTILSKYRHGIDPAAAIYNSLQKALFSYHENHPEDVWIVSLFKDKEWLTRLITALRKDINKLKQFHLKYSRPENSSPYIKKTMIEIVAKQEELEHYAEVFLLMVDWNNEY